MNRYNIVSGLPASGKSTVARQLATSLSLPLIDKDELLELIFERRGVGDAGWRKQLSSAADQEFQDRAQRSNGAILVSWWRHPLSLSESGTPTGWLAALGGVQVELYCRCDPAIAAQRFAARRRHPGHLRVPSY
jgi:hypothetical protein